MASDEIVGVCVVIPVYNEATVIADVIASVREVYPLVVCVDDGSRDESAAEIVKAAACSCSTR